MHGTTEALHFQNVLMSAFCNSINDGEYSLHARRSATSHIEHSIQRALRVLENLFDSPSRIID